MHTLDRAIVPILIPEGYYFFMSLGEQDSECKQPVNRIPVASPITEKSTLLYLKNANNEMYSPSPMSVVRFTAQGFGDFRGIHFRKEDSRTE